MSFTLNKEGVGPSETLVPVYETKHHSRVLD